MKDAGVVFCEALVRRDHSVQQLFVDGQAGDGGQQPAVPCRQQIHELEKRLLLPAALQLWRCSRSAELQQQSGRAGSSKANTQS